MTNARLRTLALLVVANALALASCAHGAAAPSNSCPSSEASMSSRSSRPSFRTLKVEGVNVFYRAAGPPDAPTVLLLHGFPSSSRMFNPLFESLVDRYRLIAPDYPGFGHSDAPSPDSFAYTFDHLAHVIDAFTAALKLRRYVLVVQDYGGPIGFRLALAHPERVCALVVQNSVAHEQGLSALWQTRRAYWADRAGHEAALRTNFLSLESTRARHVGTTPHPERIDPDTWTDEYAFLTRPGQDRIQLDLFYDYRTNVASYPAWQAYLRKYQPKTLVVWGKYDPSFTVAGARAYGDDVPDAEIHLLDAGHFALDEAAPEISRLMRDFLSKVSCSSKSNSYCNGR